MSLAKFNAEFDRCSEWLERSLAYCNGCYALEDIRNACMAGHMQLWPGERSALVTEMVIYPRKKVCIVAFAGGELDELKGMAPKVMEYAKRHGCHFASVQGRPGWVRALGFGRIVSTIAAEELV